MQVQKVILLIVQRECYGNQGWCYNSQSADKSNKIDNEWLNSNDKNWEGEKKENEKRE